MPRVWECGGVGAPKVAPRCPNTPIHLRQPDSSRPNAPPHPTSAEQNGASKINQAIFALPCKLRLLLTGTPIQARGCCCLSAACCLRMACCRCLLAPALPPVSPQPDYPPLTPLTHMHTHAPPSAHPPTHPTNTATERPVRVLWCVGQMQCSAAQLRQAAAPRHPGSVSRTLPAKQCVAARLTQLPCPALPTCSHVQHCLPRAVWHSQRVPQEVSGCGMCGAQG